MREIKVIKLAELERSYIENVVSEFGDVKKACRALGIHEATYFRKVNRWKKDDDRKKGWSDWSI